MYEVGLVPPACSIKVHDVFDSHHTDDKGLNRLMINQEKRMGIAFRMEQ